MSLRERFLEAYDREHATTMKVLRAFPTDRSDLKPHSRCKTARELAWVFSLERMLGGAVWRNEFATRPPGKMPEPPATWDAVLASYEKTHREFGDTIRGASDADLEATVKFFTAPKTVGDIRRIDFLWFLLHDEIHHRGQFSIYLRMADGKVPSIYGPSADEPWM
jgi:uncharacterized damage-inducible protein DinB